MFVQLEFNESSQPEQIEFGVTDEGDGFSGIRLYDSKVKIATGVYQEIRYSEGRVNIIGREVSLEKMSSNYLSKPWWMESLLLESKLIEKDASMLVWNNNLPVYYTNRSHFDGRSSGFTGGISAPYGLPNSDLNSVAVVLGTEAATKLFGLESSEEINNTETLFRALLVQHDIDPELISEVRKESYKFKGDAYKPLRELIIETPKKFFREDIFSYGIEKPKRYNMTSKQMRRR